LDRRETFDRFLGIATASRPNRHRVYRWRPLFVVRCADTNLNGRAVTLVQTDQSKPDCAFSQADRASLIAVDSNEIPVEGNAVNLIESVALLTWNGMPLAPSESVDACS
jgi:hypothetical protein